MDNTTVRHHALLVYAGKTPVQSYVEAGRIHLDLNGLHGIDGRVTMCEQECEDLIAILSAALADKAR